MFQEQENTSTSCKNEFAYMNIEDFMNMEWVCDTKMYIINMGICRSRSFKRNTLKNTKFPIN